LSQVAGGRIRVSGWLSFCGDALDKASDVSRAQQKESETPGTDLERKRKGRGGEQRERERERPLPRFDASSGERDFGISDQARLVLPVPS
jgi:hypothetical protein